MRLTVSRKTDVALLALRELSAHGRSMAGRDLAHAVHASAVYLSQCLAPLIEAGWIASRPGKDGGYVLAVDRLSVLDVVQAIEGPIADGRCVVARGSCDADAPCALHDVWSQARSAMAERLAAESAI